MRCYNRFHVASVFQQIFSSRFSTHARRAALRPPVSGGQDYFTNSGRQYLYLRNDYKYISIIFIMVGKPLGNEELKMHINHELHG